MPRKATNFPARVAKAGFTTVELVVTLALIAIGLGLSTPVLLDYNSDLRLKGAVARLHADLMLARNSAVHGNVEAVACPVGPAPSCATHGLWSAGWMVFVDNNGDRERQDGERLLSRSEATDTHIIHSSAHRNRLAFFPDGSAPGSNVTVTFCDARGADKARQLVVSNSGRIRRKIPAETRSASCPG